MGKPKLKAALDAHKGVDYKHLRDEKTRKLGEKRKREKEQKKAQEAAPSDVEMSQDDEDGGVLIDEEAVGTELDRSEEQKLQAELKALLGDKKKLMEIDSGSEVDEDEWEDEEDGESENEADEEDEQGLALARLADSESESDSEDDDADEGVHISKLKTANGSSKVNGTIAEDEEDDDDDDDDNVEGSDIPLSDIESLASDERGDVIPHQRLTINNKSALQKSLSRIALPLSTLPFSAHQVITSSTNTANSIPDIDDDLARELAFYAQSLSAVKEARTKLAREGTPFTRPVDYFAEMVKSDEHMGKVKDKLRDAVANKKAAAEARRQRDLKKFGKQVQVAKMQERAKEKRDTLDKINVLKRKRSGAMPSSENEPDLFDVSVEDSATTAKKDRESRRSASGANGAPNPKRQKKDAKYGFGGKKRFAKSTDAESAADMTAHPGRGMKKPFGAAAGGGKGKGGKLGKSFRPGKSKRVGKGRS